MTTMIYDIWNTARWLNPSDCDAEVDWAARWIAPATTIAPGQWACFRRRFCLNQPVSRPILRIACDTKYWLWIDGRLIVYEGQLKRGPTPGDTYFDHLTLEETLDKGDHDIAILVWYFGKHGFSHNSSGHCALLFELLNPSSPPDPQPIVVSDAQWLAIRHEAYQTGGDPRPNYRLAEPNILFDARLEPQGWQTPGFDDSDWTPAVEIAAPPAPPWGRLISRPTPLFLDEDVVVAISPDAPSIADGRPVICPLPYNLHAHPVLDIEAASGQMIHIRTDNYTGGGAENVRAAYVTRQGRQSYESFGWMNGHHLRFDVPAGVVIHGLGYRQTRYPTDWLGRFVCDDEGVNRLYEKSCRTLDVCMRDTYMDCPDRERAQWWGDVVIQMGAAFYACDAERAPLLGRKAMCELIGWQRPDRTIYSPIPTGIPRAGHEDADRLAGCWDAELPSQMLASIGWYGFWTYYLYTGDRRAIECVYPAAEAYLNLYHFDPIAGLIDPRAGGWDWCDWGGNVDTHVLINGWYGLALRAMFHMSDLLNRPLDAARYLDRYDRLRRGFQRAFWHGDHFRSDQTLADPDDRAQAIAVLAGFADASHKSGILQSLLTYRHAGPYMEKYIIEALYLLNEPEAALQRLTDRYAQQTQSDLSTLWEGWTVNDATWGGGTYNHAWSSGSITLLLQYAAGIAPLTPGFKRFSVRPQMGSLRSLDALVPTRFGPIRLKIDRDNALACLEVPPGTIADFAGLGLAMTLPAGEHLIDLPLDPAATDACPVMVANV